MTATAWRVVQAKHREGAFSGEGARDHGGRWNGKGWPVVYAAGSLSLAVLEILVHLDDASLLSSFGCFPVRIPAGLVEVLPLSELPADWARTPAPGGLQAIGERWLRSGSSVALEVPSAAYRMDGAPPPESNILFNPVHRDFAKLGIGEFRRLHLDDRLVVPSR